VTTAPDNDRRLLFLASTARDGSSAQTTLSPLGIRVDVCRTFGDLLHQIPAGAGALLIPEETATFEHNILLKRLLDVQPQWSDLPIIVLARPGADSIESAEAVQMLGNVTLLERPLRIATLVSAVRTSLRARDRQYQIREHLARHAASEEALRLADQRKDEFLATLGHELRNPLSPLLTAVHLLKTAEHADSLTARVSAVMERQISHLVRLVDDLLELSRITRGRIEIHREDIDLVPIVQASIDSCKPLLDAAGHVLHVEFPPERITVCGDAVRLTQVFSNILTNATKYTDVGGHIWVAVRRHGNQALVTVRDNGIGIAPDQLTAVFEMFTQVDRSNRRAQGGLGIGLTLVKSLVAMHEGRVEAPSDGPGRGSEFVIELPLVVGRQSSLPLSTPAPLKRFPQRRILIVDDNRDGAETLGELLSSLGAIVSVVHSGRAALAQMDSFRPEAVLLDLGMPVMDGYEVAQRIRASAHHAVLLVALTGWGQAHDQRRSVTAGFDHHLVKPLDIEQLRQVLLADRSPGAHETRSTENGGIDETVHPRPDR
jgi:two-component system, sensor histidine kinase